jgi:hypothetical protein
MLELGEYLRLLCGCSTDLIGSLFVRPEFVIYQQPLMRHIIDIKQDFLTKEIGMSFGGNALTEVAKAGRINENVTAKRDEVIKRPVVDFCYVMVGNGTQPLVKFLASRNLTIAQCGLSKVSHTKGIFCIYGDNTGKYRFRGITVEKSNEPRLSDISKEAAETCFLGYMYYNADDYKVHCKKYANYQDWLVKHNPNRYVTQVGENGKTVDAKALMHALRISELAEQVLDTGTLDVYCTPEQRERYLAVREGIVNPDEIFEKTQTLVREVRARFNTDDRFAPCFTSERAFKLLLGMRQEFYGIG